MARKLQLDSSIAMDIKAVASDSFVDSISMIDIDLIKPTNDNFFSLSDIEILAEDIERQGLKHNLVVSEDKDQKGTYWLKSGHRRFEAIKFLLKENKLKNKTVPCLVDGIKTKSENMLDLIMLNATTRVMSDSEIIQQYEMLEKTYKELELQGKKFKGRLRERIAKALNVSSAQIGKMEHINRYATSEIKDAVIKGKMSISTANEIANLDEEEQLIENKPVSKISHKEVKEKTQPKPKKKAEKPPEIKEEIQEYEEKIIPDFELEPEETQEKISDNFNANKNSKPLILSEEEINVLNKFLPDLIDECKQTEPHYYLVLSELLNKLK